MPSSPPSLMFAPLRPSASVVVSIHLLGRSLTVFAEHEIKGKAVGKTIEAELLQSPISLLLCPLDNRNKRESKWKWSLYLQIAKLQRDGEECCLARRRDGIKLRYVVKFLSDVSPARAMPI